MTRSPDHEREARERARWADPDDPVAAERARAAANRTKRGCGSYRVILADPPWSYRNFKAASHGAAESAMEVMATDDICAIPVAEKFASLDCLLFLWGTWPKLPDARRVLAAWGFDYISGFPWVKYTPSTAQLRTGIGFWTQGMSEFVFIGKRGKAKKKKGDPVKGLLCGSEMQFYAPPGSKHSSKPQELHSWIERIAPAPRAELFARVNRPGWDCYGLDLGWKLTENGAERVYAAPEDF